MERQGLQVLRLGHGLCQDRWALSLSGRWAVSPSSDLLFRESHNRVLRELAVLGYLSQLQPPVPKPLRALHGLTPYQVTWALRGIVWLPVCLSHLFIPLHSCHPQPWGVDVATVPILQTGAEGSGGGGSSSRGADPGFHPDQECSA